MKSRLKLDTNFGSRVGMRSAFEFSGSASVTTERSGSQEPVCHLEKRVAEADSSLLFARCDVFTEKRAVRTKANVVPMDELI